MTIKMLVIALFLLVLPSNTLAQENCALPPMIAHEENPTCTQLPPIGDPPFWSSCYQKYLEQKRDFEERCFRYWDEQKAKQIQPAPTSTMVEKVVVKEVVITATPAPTPIYNDYLINSYTPENTTLYTQEQVELLKDLYIKQKELEALEATMSSEPSVTPTSGTTITDESENLGFFQRLGSFINSVRKYIANIFKW